MRQKRKSSKLIKRRKGSKKETQAEDLIHRHPTEISIMSSNIWAVEVAEDVEEEVWVP